MFSIPGMSVFPNLPDILRTARNVRISNSVKVAEPAVKTTKPVRTIFESSKHLYALYPRMPLIYLESVKATDRLIEHTNILRDIDDAIRDMHNTLTNKRD